MNNHIQLVLKSSTTELSLNDKESGIYLVPELDGLTGLPEIRTTSGVNAGYDGGWTSAQNYDARSITIRGVIANENVDTVEKLRKKLTSLAGQGKSEELTLDLVTEGGNAYTLQVRTIALEMSMQGVLQQQEFMLQLRADDPLIYDAGESQHEALLQVAKATGGFRIDFELPLAIDGGSEQTTINNDGLEEVPTITRMYGALHNPKIINHTTNQYMQIEAELGYAEGEWHTPSDPVEGEYITLNDTPENAPFSQFELEGNTEQDGTPTPDAPIPVQTVAGINTVEICGRNLFNYQDKRSVDVPYSVDAEGWLTVSYDNTSGSVSKWCNYWTNNLPLKLSTKYTVIAEIKSVSGSGQLNLYSGSNSLNSQIQEYSAGKDFSSLASDSIVYNIVTSKADFTNTATGIRSFVAFGVGQSGSITFRLSVIEGETPPSSNFAYEPFMGQKYLLNLNENLYDKSTATAVGTSLQNIEVSTAVEASTSYVFDTTDKSWATVILYNSSNVQTRTLGGQSSAKKVEFTTTSSEVKAELIFYSGQNNVNIETYDFSHIQFYNPDESIELCKIGTYQDYIYKSGGKWYVHKATHKIVLNGAESWSRWTTGQDDTYQTRTFALPTTFYGDNVPIYPQGSAITDLAKSNMTVVRGTAWGNSPSTIALNPTDNLGLQYKLEKQYLNYTDSMTSEELVALFKTWLGSHITSLYYALATPTDTEITNSALIEQLDAVANARIYGGQTNIAALYMSPNVGGTMEIAYMTEQNPDRRDEIVIDSRLRTITLNGLDIYHLKTAGSEFLMLAPGENKLSLQSDITGDNGYAEVSYKQGYLSI